MTKDPRQDDGARGTNPGRVFHVRKASIHRIGAACAALVAIALCICGAKRQVQASAQPRESEMSEADILSTAHARIERYRKSDAVVRVVDGAGAPVAGARVKIEQIRHAFLFGCNAFPVLGYDDPKLEQAYEEQFAALFNYATLGFYWGAYEREPGQTQEKRLRRQAEWCKAHGIATKGHPLVWHEVYPSWGPSEVQGTKEKLRARVTDIVSGFKGLVDRWDVVNEATVSAEHDNGVGHWAKQEGAFAMVAEALGWARAANPKAVLLYNDFKLDEDYEKLAAELTSGSKTLVDTCTERCRGRGRVPRIQGPLPRYGDHRRGNGDRGDGCSRGREERCHGYGEVGLVFDRSRPGFGIPNREAREADGRAALTLPTRGG